MDWNYRNYKRVPNIKRWVVIISLKLHHHFQKINLIWSQLQKHTYSLEAHIEQARVDQKRVDYEEFRRTASEETKQQRTRAQYLLAAKRYVEQLAQQQRVQEENLRTQENRKCGDTENHANEHDIEAKERNKSKLLEHRMRAKAKQIRLKVQEYRDIDAGRTWSIPILRRDILESLVDFVFFL